MLINVEYDSEGKKVDISCDHEGLLKLKELIEGLLATKEKNDHLHLMTPSWGGSELTEEKPQEGYKLINHLKIYKWE